MRTLICGSRHLMNITRMWAILDAEHAKEPVTVVIEGEARGADKFARAWAETNGIPVEPFPANWKLYGKAAGPIRNRQMLNEGKPDRVWAFAERSLEDTRGTLNMVTQARSAGIPTIFWTVD